MSASRPVNVLGLQFGHDASVTVVSDGRILCHVLRERVSRNKKHCGLTRREIDGALADAGIELADIDYCAIVSTQDVEILTGLVDDFSIDIGDAPELPFPSPFRDLLRGSGIDPGRLMGGGLRQLFADTTGAANAALVDRWRMLLPEWQGLADGTLATVGWLNGYTTHDRWLKPRTLAAIAADGLDGGAFTDAIRLGMHYPVTVRLGGVTLPAVFVDHHVCHGASAFYRSSYDRAAILTHDGGDPRRNLSGYFMYGEGSDLYVLAPHQLALGGLYRNTGVTLGFDVLGAEGKLMGLSSYGRPRFFSNRFVGNFGDAVDAGAQDPFRQWIGHCLDTARARGYAMDYGTADTVLGRLSIDIAASTQKLFEETYLAAVDVLDGLLAGAGKATSQLCLSGGCALNCPSNSRVYNESAFDELYIDPNCDDGGLSVGAALFVHHNLLGNPVEPDVAKDNRSPYRGPELEAGEVEAAVGAASDRYEVGQPEAPAQAAAADIAAGKIVAWFEGRSEMGPRALCHRSLLANPADADNWRRVNEAKRREQWRPLAPAVLAERAADWFAGCPEDSPYMLFTARVLSRALPAITHVDGSARIQTVDADAGTIYRVLEVLDETTGIPVVMNTSLNGPGEPIVERPGEALAFLDASGIDVLYLDGWRIARMSDGEAHR